jgi:hypothetical protein
MRWLLDATWLLLNIRNTNYDLSILQLKRVFRFILPGDFATLFSTGFNGRFPN